MKGPGFFASLGLLRSLGRYYGKPWRGQRFSRLYRPFVPSGGLAFDVGAHVGNRTRCWRRLGARVVAVEPQAACVAVLRRLFSHDENVTIVPAGVGRVEGAATLFESRANPSVATLSAEWIRRVQQDAGFSRVTWERGQTVPVTTLDALRARYGEPDFIKLDVEGFEAEALAGLSHGPPALSFEYVTASPAVTEACLMRLEQLGQYRFAFSRGESHRLEGDWTDSQALVARLADRRLAGSSGDVYARRADDRL